MEMPAITGKEELISALQGKGSARTQRALAILLDHAITIGNWGPGSYIVHSQEDLSKTYNVKVGTGPTTDPPRCDCRDRSNYCKHLRACLMAEAAMERARELAAKYDITIHELDARITRDLCAGVPARLADALTIILIGAQLAQLEHDSAAAEAAANARDGTPFKPQKIELVIRFRTAGARDNPTIADGELVSVVEDGQQRKPRHTNADRALAQLQAAGYAAAGHKWMDPAGLVRRRRSIYQLPA